MNIGNRELQTPDPERQIEFVRKFLRGEKIKEYRGDIRTIIQIARMAIEKAGGDSGMEEELARLNKLVQRKLAGENIKLEEIDLPDTQEEEEPSDEILEPDKLIAKIEGNIEYAETLLKYPEVMINSDETVKELIEKIKKMIDQAKSDEINVEIQEEKFSDLIQKRSDILKSI